MILCFVFQYAAIVGDKLGGDDACEERRVNLLRGSSHFLANPRSQHVSQNAARALTRFVGLLCSPLRLSGPRLAPPDRVAGFTRFRTGALKGGASSGLRIDGANPLTL